MKKDIKIIAAVVAFVVIAVLVTVLCVVLIKPPNDGSMSADRRVDCYVEVDDQKAVDAEKCRSRGCIYFDDFANNNSVPVCYFPAITDANSRFGFNVDGDISRTQNSITVSLTSRGARLYDEDLPRLTASFQYHQGGNVLRLQIKDSNKDRYEVPVILTLSPPSNDENLYDVDIVSLAPFAFKIKRTATNEVIFDTTLGGFVYEDQFIQIATQLPTNKFYGLGENQKTFFQHDFTRRTTWAAFAKDQPLARGIPRNLYGVHPFYICVEKSGKTHGVLIFNSNAMEFTTTLGPKFVYRTSGGILDIMFILGDSPESVIRTYHQIIGKPYMPPFWSLGFQLSRWGFQNISHMQSAINRTLMAQIPLDVVHADIDHMDERKDFTIDPINYPGFANYVKRLRDELGIRTIMILDPGLITNGTNYRPYDLGREMDVFVRWPNASIMPRDDFIEANGTMMLGYCWPRGKVAYPDYFRSATNRFWEILIEEHYRQKMTFDGLWIDMNEPASFGTNRERAFNWPEKDTPYWTLKCPANSRYERPTYMPRAARFFDNDEGPAQMSDTTLCMDAIFGEKPSLYKHYDVHSLYGWSQTESTLTGLRKATGRRGLVLSRSTFPGAGKMSGHWLGDNDSRWQGLQESIVGMMDFSMFGFSYIGADICGFFAETTPYLCTRWMQLGAFYPFSRNHNAMGNKDQDPGLFDPVLVESMKKALRLRYRLLMHLYTLFDQTARFGGTLVRPLFFEFPNDEVTYNISSQFLWGDSVLISPVLTENETIHNYYLPTGKWYRMTDSTAPNITNLKSEVLYTAHIGGRSYTQENVEITTIPEVHLRAGYSLYMKPSTLNTDQMRRDPTVHILVGLQEDMSSKGMVYWDDGDEILTGMNIFRATFSCVRQNEQSSCLHTVTDNGYANMTMYYVKTITLLGFGFDSCRVEQTDEIVGQTTFNEYRNITQCKFDDNVVKMNQNFKLNL